MCLAVKWTISLLEYYSCFLTLTNVSEQFKWGNREQPAENVSNFLRLWLVLKTLEPVIARFSSKACHFFLWSVMNLPWKGCVHQRFYVPRLDAGLDCFSEKRIPSWLICCWYCIQKYHIFFFSYFYPSIANPDLALFCDQSLKLYCNIIISLQ